jgi:hypothetical protein
MLLSLSLALWVCMLICGWTANVVSYRIYVANKMWFSDIAEVLGFFLFSRTNIVLFETTGSQASELCNNELSSGGQICPTSDSIYCPLVLGVSREPMCTDFPFIQLLIKWRTCSLLLRTSYGVFCLWGIDNSETNRQSIWWLWLVGDKTLDLYSSLT